MTRFRPCIDIHAGCVKQIVGGTLSERPGELKTNFVSPHSPEYFAEMYRRVRPLVVLTDRTASRAGTL